MEQKSDRVLAARLKGFEQVWRRVTAAPDARREAARQGVKLKPREKPNRCCQRRRH